MVLPGVDVAVAQAALGNRAGKEILTTLSAGMRKICTPAAGTPYSRAITVSFRNSSSAATR